MSFQFEKGEILLVGKPYSWTSFDVVGKIRSLIRRYTGLKKVKIGHAGTLDPLATGLLILCTGKFTKRIEEFQDLDKEYTGTFRLGITTPSYDLETEPGVARPVDHLTPEALVEAAAKLTGTYDQVPPLYSARWIDGKRAYTFARKEVDKPIEPRKVTITAFELSGIALPEIEFRVVCSKGTYIRSLARDFGEALGCGAHLTALCRTRIGPYHLRDAFTLQEIEEQIQWSGLQEPSSTQ